jgi:hypothetical protein
VRGRAWIPLLGLLLAGIVATQVEILKLSASMGRSLEQNGTLTTENQLLQASVASLGNDQRIEQLASGMGMVEPPPGAVGFLAAEPGGDVSGALGNLHAQDPSWFLSVTPSNGAVVTGAGTSTLTESSASGVPASTPGTPPATVPTVPTGATADTGATGATGATAATGPTGTQTSAGGSADGSAGAVAASPPTQSAAPAPAQSQPIAEGSAGGAAAIQPAGSAQQDSGG